MPETLAVQPATDSAWEALGASGHGYRELIQALKKGSRSIDLSLAIGESAPWALVPLLERRWGGFGVPVRFSLAFGLYGGPLSVKPLDDSQWIGALRAAAEAVPMKGFLVQNPFAEARLAASGFRPIARAETHVLRLAGFSYPDLVDRSFDSDMRYQIRKALRADLTLRKGTDLPLIRDFYGLYLLSNHRWGRKNPKYSLCFFEAFEGSSVIEIRMAYHADRPVAGIVILKLGTQHLYWFGAMDKDSRSLCANPLLLSNAIEEAAEARAECFNFGASGKLVSVRKFKESFGAEPLEYGIYYRGPWVLQRLLAAGYRM